jgi:hypothetical protein
VILELFINILSIPPNFTCFPLLIRKKDIYSRYTFSCLLISVPEYAERMNTLANNNRIESSVLSKMSVSPITNAIAPRNKKCQGNRLPDLISMLAPFISFRKPMPIDRCYLI